MAQRCLSTCFVLYVLLSLLTHIAELVLNAMLAYTLYQEVAYRDVFFALTAGVLIIPLVTTQLLSAIFLLRRRGDSMSGGEAVLMAVLHVLQLGFIWRHVSVLREKDVLVKKVDLSELFVLRLTFTFAAGFPLMLMQLFLVLTEIQVDWQWVLYAALVASMLSTVWSVASFRRSHETSGPDAVVLSWPGSLFRLLWRAGEVVSRVISLTLFASLYKEWVFLVLGFHWVIMLVCVSVPQTVSGEWCGSTLFQRVVFCVVTSYAYVFCYVNFCTVKSAVWYTLYYVIMFLENGTLSIVWLTKSDSTDFSSRYLLVFVSALAFFAAMVCLAVYFKFFHVATEAPLDQSKAGVCVAKTGPGGCINCRLSLCTKHQHTGQQRPFSSGWMSHYHSAVTHGQYYKHAMHDSLLDSMSDLTSMTTAGSTNRRLQQKLSALDKELSESEGAGYHRSGRGGRLKCGCGREGDLEGGVSSCQTTSCAACHHRRLIKTSRSDLTDTTSVLTLEGGASQNLGYEGSDESQSNNIPAWLPAGESYIARQLLTGTPDSAGALSEKLRQQKQEKNLEHYRSLLKQEAQRWASDGYSTDHTVLEWSKLPVTVLGKNVWGIQDPESECCAYCCNEMSPGDSEVSSIFRAAHGAQLEACPGCNGGGGSCGGDVVYGVPLEMVHLRHKGHHKPASISDSEITCACCAQQHEQILRAHQLQKQQQQQQKVFTISGKDDESRVAGSAAAETKSKASRASSEASIKKSKGGASKRSKSSERRRSKDREKSTIDKGDVSSVSRADRSIDSRCLDAVSVSSGGDIKSDALSQDSTVAPSVPSKLQVKAIAEKCDESKPPGPKHHHSSEPIYENLCSRAETNKSSPQTDDSPKSTTTSEQTDEKDSSRSPPRTVHVHNVELTEIQPALKASRSRDNRRHSTSRSDAWYVCSESEDSALPPETFSSSNDSHCFTGSDADSDGSLELII